MARRLRSLVVRFTNDVPVGGCHALVLQSMLSSTKAWHPQGLSWTPFLKRTTKVGFRFMERAMINKPPERRNDITTEIDPRGACADLGVVLSVALPACAGSAPNALWRSGLTKYDKRQGANWIGWRTGVSGRQLTTQPQKPFMDPTPARGTQRPIV